EGWAQTDLKRILDATASSYRFTDPFIGSFDGRSLHKYFDLLQDRLSCTGAISRRVAFFLQGPMKLRAHKELQFWREDPTRARNPSSLPRRIAASAQSPRRARRGAGIWRSSISSFLRPPDRHDHSVLKITDSSAAARSRGYRRCAACEGRERLTSCHSRAPAR